MAPGWIIAATGKHFIYGADNRTKAEDSSFNEMADNLAFVLEKSGLSPCALDRITKAVCEGTVKDKNKGFNDLFYFIQKGKETLRAEALTAKKAEEKIHNDRIRGYREAILKAEVSRINSSDSAYQQSRIDSTVDLGLVAEVGDWLRYMEELRAGKHTDLFAAPAPRSDSAKILRGRIESRKPKPEPFAPIVTEDSEARKRRLLWLGAGNGEEPEA